MLAPDTHLKDRYRILHQIGRGGFGTVYKAVDEVLSCSVAIKETKKEVFSQEKLKKAFEREAQLLRNLKHECLPRVTDYFLHDDTQFLVMDFIEGEDLAALLKRRLASGGPFSVSEILPWADRILSALDYLHSLPEPIIHRDIKPGNIKLGNDGIIYLLDFGLAKGAAGQMSTIREDQSTFSLAAYTHGYAPLEQEQESGTQPQSDIYAFGATLYHLLTGQLPIRARQRDEAVQRGLADPLKPAHEVYRAIPVAISQVIEHAMTIRWWDRLASAKEMRAALSAAAGDLVSTQPQPVGDIAKPAPLAQSSNEKVSTNHAVLKPNSVRRPLIIGSLALVVIAIFAGGGRWALNRFKQGALVSSSSVSGFRLKPPLTEHQAKVWSIAFSRDGGLAASGDDKGKVILWDTNTWTPSFLPGHQTPVYSLAFSPDGMMLASAGQDNTMRLWNARTKTQMSSLQDGEKSIFRVVFSPDNSAGNVIASISGSDPAKGGGEIRLWYERDGWRPIKLSNDEDSQLYAIAFSPSGHILAAAGYGDKITLWDLTSKKIETNLSINQPAEGFVNKLIFSPDGEHLVAGSRDGSIRLWRTHSRTQTWFSEPSSNEHGTVITALAFSPDSTTLVSASGFLNPSIRQRNIVTGKSDRLLTNSNAVSLSLAFSPDGKTLLSGSEDGTINTWQVGTDQ